MLKNFDQALGQTLLNVSDIITGMLTRKIMIIFSISLYVGVFIPAPTYPSTIKAFATEGTENTEKIKNISLTDKTFSTKETMIFEREIKPFIQNKFEEDISDEYLLVERKLLKVQLFRVENIDGRDVYSVHLDFVVRITERDSGFEHITLRGQETLFLIKNGKIKDIVPFDEYVVEKDEKEVKKFVTEEKAVGSKE